MDTAQRNIMFQVQFWGLIGPLIALFTLLVIFIKSPSSAIELSFITIIGLLAAWKWKMQGFAVSLGTTFLLYLYQFSTIENDEHLWHIGMNISIVTGCMIAALSYREVEQLLQYQDVKADANTDAKIASIDFSEVKRLENNILALEHDVAAKVKQLQSYEALVDHVKIEMVKTNQQHEKLLDEFFQKQNQLSLAQEQLNEASNHIKILSEKSTAEVKVDLELQKELATKNNQISSLEKVIKDLQIQIQSNLNTPTKPCQHDVEIQELKSTNELLARERGRLETCLFRTQIDLHQKTQDLANFPTLQSDFENLETKNNRLMQALKEAENRLYEKEVALQEALTDSIKDSEITFQALENEKQNLKEALQTIENDLQLECQKNEALETAIAKKENELENKLELFKDLETQTQTLKLELQTLENDLRNDLKSQIKENEVLKATLAEYEYELETKLDTFKDQINNLRIDLSSECQKNEVLKATVAEYENELEAKLDELKDLQILRNNLSSECQKNKVLKAAVAEKEYELETKLDTFKDQINNLRNDLSSECQKNNDLRNDLSSECQKNEALKAIVAEKEYALQNNSKSFKDLENESQNQKQAFQVLENDLRNDLSSECRKNEALKAVVEEKEHALENNFKSFKDLEDGSQLLTQKLKNIENDLDVELQKNEALKASFENLRLSYEEKNQNLNPESILTTEEFKELHFNYKKVEGKYNQLKEQFEQKSEVLNETRRQLFRAEEKVMQLKLDYDEESVYELNESTASMEQHILTLWDESHEKIQELNQEIKALQSIITTLSK